MTKALSDKKKLLVIIISSLVIFSSLALGIHNATLYNPSHGFDGDGHVFYINYVYKNWSLPPPNLNWETHQSPLYYFLGAITMRLTGQSWKIAQYLNTFILWMIIVMTGLGLWKVFKKIDQVLIGMFALAALPMLNIFTAMMTNELLNTFWIISVIISILYLISSKTKKVFILSSLWLGLSMILGVWTKISIIIMFPFVIATVFILLLKNIIQKKIIIFVGLTIILLFVIFALPLFQRSRTAQGPSNVIKTASNIKNLRSLDFYFRLDWIPNVDMYNTQYYSLIGGAWNSFWSDGHNAITPFVKFHKKAFILWSLGFILLPICLYGLKESWKVSKLYTIIVYLVGIEMLAMYVVYNNMSGHYSAARLTYEMGIVVPYSFGLAAAATNKKFKKIILALLSIQFIIMVSFFWIQPWWFSAK